MSVDRNKVSRIDYGTRPHATAVSIGDCEGESRRRPPLPCPRAAATSAGSSPDRQRRPRGPAGPARADQGHCEDRPARGRKGSLMARAQGQAPPFCKLGGPSSTGRRLSSSVMYNCSYRMPAPACRSGTTPSLCRHLRRRRAGAPWRFRWRVSADRCRRCPR